MDTTRIRQKAEAASSGDVLTLTSTLFPTDLGWCGFLAGNDVLYSLTFGHRSAGAARRALRAAYEQLTADCSSVEYVCEEREDWSDLRNRLERYARGEAVDFADIAVADRPASRFTQRVIRHVRKIPYGKVRSYGELAKLAGSPNAARAVGNLMAKNRCPLVIPCHRVVGAGNRLGGYSAPAGLPMKRRLLDMEADFVGTLASSSSR